MPNVTLRANVHAMPIDRRAALGAIAAGVLFAGATASAAKAADLNADAEIIALSAEIVRRCAEAGSFIAERLEPHDSRFHEILEHGEGRPDVRWAEAWAFSDRVGRSAAVDALAAYEQATDRLFDRMMAIPATTPAGRAAKVRALLVHVMHGDWRGAADELDWDKTWRADCSASSRA